MKRMIEMFVDQVVCDPQTHAPLLILASRGGRHKLALFIDPASAQAIVSRIESVDFARPMPHDLLAELVGALGAEVVRVELPEPTTARLRLKQGTRALRLEARASDAIALALRTGAPIFVAPRAIEASARADAEVPDAGAAAAAYLLAELPDREFGKWKM